MIETNLLRQVPLLKGMADSDIQALADISVEQKLVLLLHGVDSIRWISSAIDKRLDIPLWC